MNSLKETIQEAMKNFMRAQDKPRLSAVRMILAAIKQREVDERITLEDADVLAALDKMAKQRRESIAQFEQANRQDLVDKEKLELTVIQSFLPEQLSEAEMDALISETIEAVGAASMKDMGKVMGLLKPKLQGRADMSLVSGKIKAALQ